MKKFGSFALAALLVAALSVSASAASTSQAAKGTATIDGKKDNIYACDPLIIDIEESTGAKTTDGATAKAWMAYDETNLYVYIEVTDKVVTPKDKVTGDYQSDSPEVYVNFEGKDGKIADINAAQITWGPEFKAVTGGGKYLTANKANIKTAYEYTDYGYTCEYAIPFAGFDAKEGATIGFSIGINDDNNGDAKLEKHTFDGEKLGSAWQTADAAWGTLTLTSKKYEPKKDTAAAATADMGIVAAAASLAASGAAYISLKKRK